jgi:hypothetical protein
LNSPDIGAAFAEALNRAVKEDYTEKNLIEGAMDYARRRRAGLRQKPKK